MSCCYYTYINTQHVLLLLHTHQHTQCLVITHTSTHTMSCCYYTHINRHHVLLLLYTYQHTPCLVAITHTSTHTMSCCYCCHYPRRVSYSLVTVAQENSTNQAADVLLENQLQTPLDLETVSQEREVLLPNSRPEHGLLNLLNSNYRTSHELA